MKSDESLNALIDELSKKFAFWGALAVGIAFVLGACLGKFVL
jgi:hypothetical protein